MIKIDREMFEKLIENNLIAQGYNINWVTVCDVVNQHNEFLYYSVEVIACDFNYEAGLTWDNGDMIYHTEKLEVVELDFINTANMLHDMFKVIVPSLKLVE